MFYSNRYKRKKCLSLSPLLLSSESNHLSAGVLAVSSWRPSLSLCRYFVSLFGPLLLLCQNFVSLSALHSSLGTNHSLPCQGFVSLSVLHSSPGTIHSFQCQGFVSLSVLQLLLCQNFVSWSVLHFALGMKFRHLFVSVKFNNIDWDYPHVFTEKLSKFPFLVLYKTFFYTAKTYCMACVVQSISFQL